MQTLIDHWNATQMGQLMKDPIMEPFREDLERQFEEQWMGNRNKVGLTIDDLRGVPAGEVVLALMRPGPDQAAVVLLVDVTRNLEKAEATIKKAEANLLDQGAKKRTEKVGGVDVDVFDLPKDRPDDEEEPQRQAALLMQDDLLIVADSTVAVEAVLERRGGSDAKCLADVPAFQSIMKRCADDASEDAVPQIRWFVEIFGYAEAARTIMPERNLPRGKTLMDTLRDTGFEALTGLGGHVSFDVEGYEFVHRTVVHAPPPYEKAMKMLSFPNEADFVPQTWVPRDVATYTTTYLDIHNAFDNFGPLFDELFGEGETGVWPDVLDGLKNDKHGPQIDLEVELIDQLGNQVTIVTDFELPISTTSERILIAIEVENEAAVAKALEKLLKEDETVAPHELEDRIIWVAEPREEKPLVPSISLDAIPMLPGEDPLAPDPADEEPEAAPLFPNLALTVGKGQLFISSHLDYLVKVLKEQEEHETLASAVDFQVIRDEVKEISDDRCAWVFSRTDKEYRPTYELIRQGKMPESETMLGRALNTVFGAGKKGVLREQEVDGSELPEFEVVRRHLGTAGGFGLSEENGWFLKGFMLSKEVE
jgi:hypothetical protein